MRSIFGLRCGAPLSIDAERLAVTTPRRIAGGTPGVAPLQTKAVLHTGSPERCAQGEAHAHELIIGGRQVKNQDKIDLLIEIVPNRDDFAQGTTIRTCARTDAGRRPKRIRHKNAFWGRILQHDPAACIVCLRFTARHLCTRALTAARRPSFDESV